MKLVIEIPKEFECDWNRYLILLGPRLIICFLQYTHFIFSPINIVISPANNSPY